MLQNQILFKTCSTVLSFENKECKIISILALYTYKTAKSNLRIKAIDPQNNMCLAFSKITKFRFKKNHIWILSLEFSQTLLLQLIFQRGFRRKSSLYNG